MTLKPLGTLGLMAITAALFACSQKAEDKAVNAEAAALDKARSDAKAAEDLVKTKEAQETGIDAYVYAYPLVTMELTRRVLTNVVQPEGPNSPMGQFARLRTYPPVDNHTVTAPNADTLYTIVWLDVSKEPWVLRLPDMKGRYFLLPMLDAWTNVFQVPGKRTTGTGAQTYVITGPGWAGTIPAGMTEYKAPTELVWIIGRIYCTGTPEDYATVHALQDKVTTYPLSSLGKTYTPVPGTVDAKVDMKTAVRDQVNALDAASYFKLFAQLLKANPPTAEDAPMVAKLAKIGIVPGQDFDASKLEPAVAKGLAGVPKPAQDSIMNMMKEGLVLGDSHLTDGWVYSTKMGLYGTNYRWLAFVTAIGLGANRPEDAIYPTSEGPGIVEKYDGGKKYVMHFGKGEMPPVNGFWSLTMYDANYFFVPNPINRYTVSQRSKFKSNADGSVDIYVQNESPGKAKEQNWLPAPKDKFILMLRLYWPKEKPPSILDGSWKIPQVKEAG